MLSVVQLILKAVNKFNGQDYFFLFEEDVQSIFHSLNIDHFAQVDCNTGPYLAPATFNVI